MKFIRLNYIKYGLIMSGVLLVCLALMHFTGQYTSFEKGGPLDIIFVLSPFVVWFLGLRAYKKSLKNGFTFKQGLAEGLRISVVFGIVSPFIFAAYYLFVNPFILDYVRTSYQLDGATKTTVILVDMAVQFAGSILMGAIYSTILTFFMRRREK